MKKSQPTDWSSGVTFLLVCVALALWIWSATTENLVLVVAMKFILGATVGIDAHYGKVRFESHNGLYALNLPPVGWAFFVADLPLGLPLIALPLYFFVRLRRRDQAKRPRWTALSQLGIAMLFVAAMCLFILVSSVH